MKTLLVVLCLAMSACATKPEPPRPLIIPDEVMGKLACELTNIFNITQGIKERFNCE